MLTNKQHTDGKFYHAKLDLNDCGTLTEGSSFLYDERNELIPISICICNAYKPGECCCATTCWDNYRYEDDY